MMVCDVWDWNISRVAFSLLFLLDQKPAAMMWGYSSSPMEGFTGWGTEASGINQHILANRWNQQLQSSFQMTAALAHILTTTLEERRDLSQDHPAKLLPNSWPAQTVWGDKYLLFCTTKFWSELIQQSRSTDAQSGITVCELSVQSWLLKVIEMNRNLINRQNLLGGVLGKEKSVCKRVKK